MDLHFTWRDFNSGELSEKKLNNFIRGEFWRQTIVSSYLPTTIMRKNL